MEGSITLPELYLLLGELSLGVMLALVVFCFADDGSMRIAWAGKEHGKNVTRMKKMMWHTT